ncbi:hypothetical protein AMIS_10120 [Actinoplanes missouriensis 431]|uniref:Uncharacterized protein n=1 Tax=Actinoplanes missouriensis (strain ATCC 14538 / DSM 43046 / CBS 188.64 / JCM 3121 / NBRC 102363 / NCIMB 12654 / NRRL B-3342 / UNCC 431) TaxID=512565 RepID=I0GZP5_ACTM4|nr:hypothetical protein [Actinoplanes missouriensis]BAL86232.1 hypothetical protein AMIS_10120 [Actinoplanes missouriensis 431]
MQKTRRFGAMIALSTAAAGMAAVSAAAPAAAAGRGPEPVSPWLQAVRANAASWVLVHWRTDRTICDARIRVRGERVRVEYPGSWRFTTFSRGDMLRPGRSDYIQLRVTPIARRNSVATLVATISYDECGRKARTQTRTSVLSMPVVMRGNVPGGIGGPGAPGHGHPDGPGHDGPGAPGHDGPGHGHSGGQGGPGGQGQNGQGQGQNGQGQGQGQNGQGGPNGQYGQGGPGQGGQGQGQGGPGQNGQGQGQYGQGQGQGQGGQGGQNGHGGGQGGNGHSGGGH